MGADVETLQTALARLLLAHDALRGCKPTTEQLDRIAFQSGVAVTAIMQAFNDTARHEQEHVH